MNQAQTAASLLHNDGQCWITDAGESFEALMCRLGTVSEYSDHGHTTCTKTRWIFPDGSVIVTAGDGWDYEGHTLFFWAGAEDWGT